MSDYLSRVFIFPSAAQHELEITAVGDRMIYIHSNSRVVGFDRGLVEDLIAGFTALLSGDYDSAMTKASAEILLRDREERIRRAIAARTEPGTVPAQKETSLDQL